MAPLKFTQVSVRVPTFFFAPGVRWLFLAAALLFAGGAVWQTLPFLRQEQSSAEVPNVFNGGMGGVGKILPCGHPSISAILSDTEVYACGHGHRFRSFGSWFMPL